MFRIKQLTIEQVIVLLFSILPVVDSVNGILITAGLPSIGTIYKVLTLAVLFVFVLRAGSSNGPMLVSCLCIIMYMTLSIFINIYIFSGELINADYPIKLLFNVLTLVLLISCNQAGFISGKAIYTILNINTWLMIVMILVPYALGLGSTIYSGGIGYKGFFYSNNELSVALIILFYFSLYRLARQISVLNLVQLGAIMICVLLLNTKSGMAACLAGGGLFAVEYLLRKDTKFKIPLILVMLLGLYVAKDFIIEQIEGFMTRQTYLHGLYGGSLLDTILSGRTFYLEDAWESFRDGPGFLFRFLFGNGFCSNHLVEMDFVDIFFYLGFFGVVGLTVFLIYIFAASLKHFKKDGTLVRPFGFFMVIGFAFLAGHIFFMATSGCYFVLLCCLCLMYCPDSPPDLHAKIER